MFDYLRNLSNPRLVLWCYFVWYLVVLARYFDAAPGIWLNSVGISLFVGFALYLNTISGASGNGKAHFWQVVRCFLTPFCVSSFAALVKGRGFFLIFSPRWEEDLTGLTICLVLTTIVLVLRRTGAAVQAVDRGQA